MRAGGHLFELSSVSMYWTLVAGACDGVEDHTESPSLGPESSVRYSLTVSS
jgi:hypothetical protein